MPLREGTGWKLAAVGFERRRRGAGDAAVRSWRVETTPL